MEEGFLTFTSLPANLLLKVGKMRASFGKVNQMHNHVLPWTDRPLVTQNLLGGEEGISDAGLSLSRLILNPVLFLEATAEVYRGESPELFSAPRAAGPHLRRPAARVPRPHGVHEPRLRRLVRPRHGQGRRGACTPRSSAPTLTLR